MKFVYHNYIIDQIFLHCVFLAAQLVLQGWASCDSVVGTGSPYNVPRSTHSVLATQATSQAGLLLFGALCSKERSEILHRLHVSKGRMEIPTRTRSG